MIRSVSCYIHVYIRINGIKVVFSFYILLYMSLKRSGYKELGLDLVEPLQD